MKDEINEVVNEETVDEVEETKSKGLLSKVKTGLKTHGKKIAVVAACMAGGLIGYAIGTRSKDDYSDCDVIDGDYEIDNSSSSEEVSED